MEDALNSSQHRTYTVIEKRKINVPSNLTNKLLCVDMGGGGEVLVSGGMHILVLFNDKRELKFQRGY